MEVKSASPGKTSSQPFIDGFDLGRETVGSDDDLFIELIEVVEDVEEFLLRFFFTDDELEIIYNEAVELAEFEIEFVAFAEANRINEIGIEMSDGGIEDFKGRVLLQECIADGLDEVGFAKTRATIQEERVVAVARGIDDAPGSGKGKVVVGADDETIEGVFGVEAGLVRIGGSRSGFAGGRDVFTDRGSSGNFAGANLGFDFGLDPEIDRFNVDIVVLEGVSDKAEVAVTELLDIERIFDTYNNITVVVFDDGGVLKPGRKIGGRYLLLNLS